MRNVVDQYWPVALFKKSPLKQRKFKEITSFLGDTHQMHCLDIGSDNGVISYLLRNGPGSWHSADLEETAVDSIRQLVKSEVYKIDGVQTPFQDDQFDRVVIVDFLEHIVTDREFIIELFRIIKPDGELIINVPHTKNTLLRRFRLAIGQTDEKHGHVRPGYTMCEVASLLEGKFTVISQKTYSRFFSEFIDTVITFAIGLVKREEPHPQKGVVVTGRDLHRNRGLFRLYSLIHPAFWLFVQLDKLLFWWSGYMLIVKAGVDKAPVAIGAHSNEHTPRKAS